MRIEVVEEPIAALVDYGSIPVAFEVGSILAVSEPSLGSGQCQLTECRLDVPYVKDYDAIDGEGPTQWAKRFDISNWGLFAARVDGRRAGGAVVAFSTPGLVMLAGGEDLAVLWDIRVSPDARKQGVGSALFKAAQAWARAKGCPQLRNRNSEYQCPRLQVLCPSRLYAHYR